MSTKNKKGPRGGAIYIVLALSVLAVVCVGVYSLMTTMFTDMPEIKPITSELPHITKKNAETGVTKNPSSNDTPVAAVPEGKNENEQEVSAELPTYSKPVNGDIIKDFSGDTLVYSYTMNDFRVHSGVDISCTVGSEVKCFTDGVIESIESDPLMGQTIIVSHAGDLQSVYQNLSDELPDGIEAGVQVKTNQVIAYTGETAMIECADEDHLHFELIEASKNISPAEFF